MYKAEKMTLVVGAVIVIFMLVGIVNIIQERGATSDFKNFALVGDRKHIIAQCRNYERTNCGVNLSGCTDGDDRFCLTNVILRAK